MKEKNISIIKYFKIVINILPKRRRKQFYILLLGMVVVAIFETGTLGIISLFGASIAAPENIINSTKFIYVMNIFRVTRIITPEYLIITLSILVVLIILIKNIILGFVRYWVARYAAVIQGHIGQMILGRYLSVDYEWHLKENAHNLFITLGWRVKLGALISGVLLIISNSIMVAIMLVGIISFQPIMMSIVLSVLALTSFFVYKNIKKFIDINTNHVLQYSKGSQLDAAKTIHGMKDVRIFGLESKFLNDFTVKVFKLARYQGSQGILKSIPVWIMETVGFSILAGAIIVMINFLKLSRVEIFGTISLLAISAWRVTPAMNRILAGISGLRINLPFIDGVYKVLDDINNFMKGSEKNKAEDPKYYKIMKLRYNDSIDFKDLSFKYRTSERVILNYINCKIKKGTSLGIVGHSGAGKSTFIDLFIGLLKPSTGGIFIDGIELTDNIVRAWRSKIGYVPQFPYIYDCSLAENIAFGKSIEEIDEKKVLEVCKNASIDFLDDLEDGIYTRIGDRGMMISGGQKQRVAIARALYNNPEILVFDEATSSLDTKSEKEIQKTIDSFRGKQTMIIVAHRLTTVENCDYLIWLEKGEIVKMDKPENILQEYIEYQDI